MVPFQRDASTSDTQNSQHPDITLTPEAASRICMEQCRAMCCRGPIILRLAPGETEGFQANAARLGVEARITANADGSGWLRFTDHPGDRCPMLDPEDFSCRSYADRPRRCREFPEKPEPGCAISGWRAGGDTSCP